MQGRPGSTHCGICGATKQILDRHLEQQRPLEVLAHRAVLVCRFCDEANSITGFRGPLSTHRARLAEEAKGLFP